MGGMIEARASWGRGRSRLHAETTV